jgi:molybdate transport system ATP-binding protein
VIELDLRLSLRAFALQIEAGLVGPTTAVFGPSGSGKTSLLEAVAGLRRGATGRIVVDSTVFLDSRRGIDLPPEKRGVGYVPQEPGLFPHLDVRSNIRYAKSGADESVVREAVALLDIAALLDRYPRTLSGGEAQRVGLARALVRRPRLLLLDEPLAALDAALKGKIVPYLLRVRDRAKIPMLYVTHHAGEALALADEAILLRRGQLIGKGPVRETLAPRALAAFPGEVTFENIVDGIIVTTDAGAGTASLAPAGSTRRTEDRTFRLSVPGAPDLAPGMAATYRVASEDVLLLRGPTAGISARNVLDATVLTVEPLGSDALVVLEAEGLEWRALVTPAAVRELELGPGAPVRMAIKTHSLERLR